MDEKKSTSLSCLFLLKVTEDFMLQPHHVLLLSLSLTLYLSLFLSFLCSPFYVFMGMTELVWNVSFPMLHVCACALFSSIEKVFQRKVFQKKKQIA